MKWTFFREIGRKLFHLLMLLVLLGYFALERYFDKKIALMALLTLLLVFILIEYLRLDLGIKIPLFQFFIRPRERDRVTGAIFFISGALICLSILDFPIALTALLMTTVGDMSAAIVGKTYGGEKIFKRKTIVGGVAEFLVNLTIGIVDLQNYVQFYVIIAMAITATIIEIFSDKVDDNLAVPVFTGFVGQILLWA